MSEHAWFQENLAGYCAGGLSAEEQERFERHRIACAACARILAEYKEFDQKMDSLFVSVRPAAGWENRVIGKLRAVRLKGATWSTWARVAASVAALLVLGGLGALLHDFVVAGNLAFPGTASQQEPEAVASRYASHAQNKLSPMYGQINANSLNDPMAIDETTETQFRVFKNLMSVARMEEHAKDEVLYSRENMAVKARLQDRTESTLSAAGDNKASAEFNLQRAPEVNKDETESLGRTRTLRLHDMDSLARGTTPLGVMVEQPDNIQASAAFNLQSQPEEVFLKKLEVTAPGTKSIAHGETKSPRSPVMMESLEGTILMRDANSQTPQVTPLPLARSESNKGQPTAEKASVAQRELYGWRGAQDKETKTGPPQEPSAGQPNPVPDSAARKIIRTGAIDFEVDSFDAAVAGITRLVGAVKGAFITTVNSDKLPNGKVKGSMVVRLPPDQVDKFLLDTRQELAKSGELKSQRIGSQDVSKQYTDVESRLRGARAMEERFLQIIKTGKGDIKDLVAAENALGIWRTKIEEMEGEIRYYNNQVGLATLTIVLIEKEIQAPAALVVTERLRMQLEVEDVDKARQAALAAVAEAKGRVTKSELKQQPAGQLEAILHFEVAPAAAGKVRDSLKQLGTVTHQDSDRNEQTEGAGSRTPDIKIKHNDVKFEVVIYNSANMQPREVLAIQVASLDVPAAFHKLQEAVAKAKGQVRTGQLNEQDKLNVSAQFDFDVPSTEKKAIDQVLAEVGKSISRTATQAAPGAAATDRKIGYRLVLSNVAALPSREKISLGIEVKDVDQTVADILDMVKSRHGNVAGVQMNHDPNGRTSSLLVFDVPLSTKDELVRQLKSAGIVRLQTSTRNARVADNELATAHIDVTLTNSGPIVPSDEGLWTQIRTSLFYSFKVLSWSLVLVITGLCGVLPLLLVVWAVYKVVSKWRRKPVASSV